MNNQFYPDERDVSFKILLPQKIEAEVLAVGLDLGGLIGISRTWKQVDCLNSPNENNSDHKSGVIKIPQIKYISDPYQIKKKYDIIVIADQSFINIMEASGVENLIKNSGVIVFMCYHGICVSKQLLQNSKYKSLSYYSALPKKSPRLFIPLKNKKIIDKGLNFYTPGNSVTRLIFTCVKYLNQLGFKYHLSKNPLIIAYNLKVKTDEGLIKFLEDQLSVKIDDLVIYAGSDQQKRKITALAVTKNACHFVVKIADTPLGSDAINQESMALKLLNQTELASCIPDLVIDGKKWYGYHVQVQSEIHMNSDRQIPTLTEQHFNFLVGLSQIDRKLTEIGKTQIYTKLCTKLKDLDFNEYPGLVTKALNIVTAHSSTTKRVVCHRTHGDFAPWNIKSNGKFFYVVDWEDSLDEGFALTDIFHFIYRQESLVGKWHSADAILYKFKKAVDEFNKNAKLPIFDFDTVLLIWCVKEYLHNSSSHIKELIGLIVERWQNEAS